LSSRDNAAILRNRLLCDVAAFRRTVQVMVFFLSKPDNLFKAEGAERQFESCQYFILQHNELSIHKSDRVHHHLLM
jgi:hypothetical protein